VIGDEVPGIALRGISKEFPWPGARCGWLEIFNQDKHQIFRHYIQSITNAKMLEVCSTSLPQYAIPLVMGDPRYLEHLERRKKIFEKRANEAYEIFSRVKGIRIVRAHGAFYNAILFDNGVLNGGQTLPISDPNVKAFVEEKVKDVQPDKRFVYYLLGATGICVVPLTGFYSTRQGFRITLLETDDEKRKQTWETITESISRYLESA
jgi:aspartate/methionine/tyrosine aminotransferase